ncbi:MAG: hypothetical protein WCH39_10305 [Schlesneria sp.]
MFTRQELDLLFNAVEKWELDDFASELASSMIESMAQSQGAPIEIRMQMKQAREEREKQRKIDRQIRKERGVLLRAKLIAIRDQMDAAQFMEGGASVHE